MTHCNFRKTQNMNRHELYDYFLSLPREQKEIVYSWGFNNETATEDGILFNVRGFFFTGIVRIIVNEINDTCLIRLENSDGSFSQERANIHFHNLIRAIDNLVEKNCTQKRYADMVKNKYELQQQIGSITSSAK